MKKTLKVEDLKKDIELCLSDEDIKQKYNLSEKGQSQLFEKFARAMCQGQTKIEIDD